MTPKTANLFKKNRLMTTLKHSKKQRKKALRDLSLEERRERFMDKVEEDITSGCWIWIGRVNASGYGEVWDGERKSPAHRYSYQLFKGFVKKGRIVLHLCNNRRCVNPQHLMAGTARQNFQHMVMTRYDHQPGLQIDYAEMLIPTMSPEEQQAMEGILKKGVHQRYQRINSELTIILDEEPETDKEVEEKIIIALKKRHAAQ